jgi:hypothetical protein
MDVDEDDDFYAPAEDDPTGEEQEQTSASHADVKLEQPEQDLEEGEEEDEGEEEGSDSVGDQYF